MRLLLTLFALASSSAFATTQPAPRLVRVHGTLTKMTATYSPIHVTQEKVCDIDGDVPVYESAVSASLENLPVCMSTVNGSSAKIYLSADVEIHKAATSNDEVKSAIGILNVQTTANDNIFQYASAGTLDLTARSILLSFSSPVFSFGTPATEETFTYDLSYDEKN